ncbi:MAG: protein kinase, partial [Myxococcales bacterium]|nr:protein kinase [Myxococcales bacterium]
MTGETSEGRGGARERSRRVLLVEDDSSARLALEALLADEGYEVRSAGDGEAALLALRGWTPDVVVTDLKLPKVDGVELMATLRQRLPGVPVIIMTGFGSIEHAVETMHLGAADYLPKPLALDRLLAALERVLRRSDDGLAIGEVVGGRYRIEGKLGEGAMGAVYRATQRGLERPVALKVIHTHNRISDARARLLREARAASALGHPNAVKIYDVGEDRGLCFLAMELLEGHDLSAEVEPGAPLDLERVYAVALEIASVLVTAHTIGLVHRDLKPENIFIERVGRDERVRVLDFGIAFLTEGDGEAGRLTQEGVIVGTPLYLAPEQAAGRAIGPSADIYAFGCLLYEMVTGDVPFRGSNMEVLSSHLRVTPPPPRTFRPELPPGLDALIMAMLRKAPAERPSAAEVEAALRRLAA